MWSAIRRAPSASELARSEACAAGSDGSPAWRGRHSWPRWRRRPRRRRRRSTRRTRRSARHLAQRRRERLGAGSAPGAVLRRRLGSARRSRDDGLSGGMRRSAAAPAARPRPDLRRSAPDAGPQRLDHRASSSRLVASRRSSTAALDADTSARVLLGATRVSLASCLGLAADLRGAALRRLDDRAHVVTGRRGERLAAARRRLSSS